MENTLIRKLELFETLPDADKHLLKALTSKTRLLTPRTDLVREGEEPEHVYLILDGLAYRYKVLRDGRRSIFAYLVPGDLCDLHVFLLKAMDHNISTVSSCTVVEISRKDALTLSGCPAIMRALSWASLVDSATLREWLVNVTRREAEAAIAHLFCELHLRLSLVGLAADGNFDLPVTQSELGDTIGLSTVHVNRSLSTLRNKGLVTFTKRRITIPDVNELAAWCGFNPNYLHIGLGTQTVQSSEAGEQEV